MHSRVLPQDTGCLEKIIRNHHGRRGGKEIPISIIDNFNRRHSGADGRFLNVDVVHYSS
jgi:hypothetical protein